MCIILQISCDSLINGCEPNEAACGLLSTEALNDKYLALRMYLGCHSRSQTAGDVTTHGINRLISTEDGIGISNSRRTILKEDFICAVDGVEGLFLLRCVTGDKYRILVQCYLLGSHKRPVQIVGTTSFRVEP